MQPTEYFKRRTAERGITMDHVTEALSNELRRARQPDGRVRIWGWAASRNQCLRIVIEADGVTLVNAFPDRACTRDHLTK